MLLKLLNQEGFSLFRTMCGGYTKLRVNCSTIYK